MNLTIDPTRTAAFDLETTGVDPRAAHVVTGSVVRLHGGQVHDNAGWMADPGIEIPDGAARIHGVTTEQARAQGRPHGEVVDDIIGALQHCWDAGYTVVAFNAAYDLRILATHAPGFTIDGPVIDPMVIDRQQVPRRRGKRTLSRLCELHGIVLDNAHTADADALAAGQLAHTMLTRHYPAMSGAPTREAMHAQRRWHEEQQADLYAYLQRVGRDVSSFDFTPWPIDDIADSPAFG